MIHYAEVLIECVCDDLAPLPERDTHEVDTKVKKEDYRKKMHFEV